MTILEKITEIEELLKKKDWFGIIENEDWSSLNKVDTHYTSWAKDITKRQINNDLPMGGDLSVIDKYFKKRDIRDVLPERWLEKLRDLKEDEKDLNISKMSFAEADFIRKFHEEKEEFFKELKADIQKTTEKGDQAEMDFESYLKNYPEKVNNIKSYSSPGNVVDMIFGVDGRFHVNSGDYFFQVKSSEYGAKPAKIKRLRIPYVSVYPKGISGQKFNYFSNINKETPSDFDNFIDNSVDLPKTLSPYERQNAALNKVLGQTGGFGSDYFKLYGNS